MVLWEAGRTCAFMALRSASIALAVAMASAAPRRACWRAVSPWDKKRLTQDWAHDEEGEACSTWRAIMARRHL